MIDFDYYSTDRHLDFDTKEAIEEEQELLYNLFGGDLEAFNEAEEDRLKDIEEKRKLKNMLTILGNMSKDIDDAKSKYSINN